MSKLQRPSISGLLSHVPIATSHAPEIWELIKDRVKVMPLPATGLPSSGIVRVPLGPNGEVPPKRRDTDIRIVCISDTHNGHRAIQHMLPSGGADILLHAGDFTDVGKAEDVIGFASWLAEIRPRFKEVVVIAGNHDLSLDFHNENWYQRNYKRFGHREQKDSAKLEALLKSVCTYLHNETVTFPELGGLKIFGSPVQPSFYNWAWNLEREPTKRSGDPAASETHAF